MTAGKIQNNGEPESGPYKRREDQPRHLHPAERIVGQIDGIRQPDEAFQPPQ
jgi:hypothetical protein